ncbi:hypothetical protein [Aquimarina sp. RZ0]|uniref:hypothetical protein n=1 Tax=Aquimarina sp. RZ0 TaxID=2607730 RepID=UPI0011F32369|nr:hypothetical protein [Aquimarina sp. RZ0]KAA1242502.1 hypothetical protein F0000_25350 [Aquimarina sp. RZ0]
MNKIESILQESGYQGKKAGFFVDTLQALNLTTPKHIADAIYRVKVADKNDTFFQGEEIESLQRTLRSRGRRPESNKSFSLQELDRILAPLSKKDIQATMAFLGQTTYRSRGERWKKQEGKRAEELNKHINTNQKRLVTNIKGIGCFEEKCPKAETKLDFSMVHGSTMGVVKSRLDHMLQHKEFLRSAKEEGLGVFMAAGDRKLIRSGKPLAGDDNVLDENGGFVKKVCTRFGSEATEAQAVQHLLETQYGLKDGMINGIPCKVVQGPKQLSENKDRTDTYGATRQVIKDILAKNPEYFKGKRDVASVSNDMYTERQGLTFKRAFEAEFPERLPERLQIVPVGPGKECPEVKLHMISDIIGATSWEKLVAACSELKQVQSAVLMQQRDLGMTVTPQKFPTKNASSSSALSKPNPNISARLPLPSTSQKIPKGNNHSRRKPQRP